MANFLLDLFSLSVNISLRFQQVRTDEASIESFRSLTKAHI